MHENREISCMSWSSDQDRSAEAINRTADVHVQEKSDCAVVPVNRPNQEGQPSAEVGEGRAQTEENIVQSRMSPTQGGNRMSLGLDGVRQAASVRKCSGSAGNGEAMFSVSVDSAPSGRGFSRHWGSIVRYFLLVGSHGQ